MNVLDRVAKLTTAVELDGAVIEVTKEIELADANIVALQLAAEDVVLDGDDAFRAAREKVRQAQEAREELRAAKEKLTSRAKRAHDDEVRARVERLVAAGNVDYTELCKSLTRFEQLAGEMQDILYRVVDFQKGCTLAREAAFQAGLYDLRGPKVTLDVPRLQRQLDPLRSGDLAAAVRAFIPAYDGDTESQRRKPPERKRQPHEPSASAVLSIFLEEKKSGLAVADGGRVSGHAERSQY